MLILELSVSACENIEKIVDLVRRLFVTYNVEVAATFELSHVCYNLWLELSGS